MRPGDTVTHRGRFWDVRRTQLRGPHSAPERWALLVVTEGAGNNLRTVAREWVRFSAIDSDGESCDSEGVMLAKP